MSQETRNGAEPGRRLESWKEIASFLDVSVRTAQSWEKDRGLPVRRLGGNRRSRVHAYEGELESWLRGADAAQEPADSAPRHDSAWRLALAAGLLLAFFAAWALIAEDAPSGGPVRLIIHGELLQALDGQGRLLWGHRLPGLDPKPYFPNVLESGRALIDDLDDDGKNEILFEALQRDWQTQSSTLLCFDTEGKTLWQRKTAGSFDGSGLELGDSFTLAAWDLVRRDGRFLLLTVAKHSPRYPAEVALIDAATGKTIGSPYFHPGHLDRWLWQDLDDDGGTELILGGINNPGPGPGRAGIVILDVPFDNAGMDASGFFGLPGPVPLAYVLFPRMDIYDALHERPRVGRLAPAANGDSSAIHVVVAARGTGLYYDLIYRGPGDVVVHDMFPADTIHGLRKRLVETGELDDPDTEAELRAMRRILVLRHAPDGNAPDLPW